MIIPEQGIDVLFRRNDEGRIYGATFIGHTTRTVLNGSRLGKDYSANVFNNLYGGNQQQVQEPIQDTRLSDVYKNTEKPTTQYDTSDSVTGGLFSILAPEPENHPNEEMPLPRRKKKKKRRYGRQM
mgnify:FL=1